MRMKIRNFYIIKLNNFYINKAGVYLLKVNNRIIRTRCEIFSKLTIKTEERRQWRRSGVFIINFKYISHLVLVFLMLTLNRSFHIGYDLQFYTGKASISADYDYLIFFL